MAGQVTIKKVGDWRRLKASLNGRKMTPIIKKEFYRACEISAIEARKDIKNRIVRGEDRVEYANAFLTIAIKRSTKPLIGTEAGAPLLNSINWSRINSTTTFAGINRKESFYDIAVVLHDGFKIKVTDRMRAMFYYLWLASEDPDKEKLLTGAARKLFNLKKSGWKLLKASTTEIEIKKRPFIERVFEDRKFIKRVQMNFEKALEVAIKKNSK